MLCEREAIDWEEYFQAMYLTEDSYLELTKNFQNSESTENPTRKWAKGPFTEHMDRRAAHEETGSTPIREADAASGRGESTAS